VDYAQQVSLPLDIVVLPQSQPGDVPLAMGFEGGRCLLVLSMRGNPEAESDVAGLDASLRPVVVEAMFAHELAHCWRQAHGQWHAWPPGFREAVATSAPAAASSASAAPPDPQTLRDARREEAFADLAGLAWTRWRHPGDYARVFAWLQEYRGDAPVPGAQHDTSAWLRRAADPRVFDGDGTPFDRAYGPWRAGLLAGD
jgi:hypothetical protein